MRTVVPVLLLSLLLCGQTSARNRGSEEQHGLVIRGQVTGLEVEKRADAVLFYVDLSVEFANEGAEPIILFRPSISPGEGHTEEHYWLGGWSLYPTEDDAKNRKSIFADGYWESVSGSDRYRALASGLDAQAPPEAYTKILQPQETWKFPDSFRIYFEPEKHSRWPELKTWREMQAYPAQLWLRIHYELSPWNVEYFKPDLIRTLAKRWRKFGNVLVEREREGRFNHFKGVSEPMPIDFSQARPKAVEEGR